MSEEEERRISRALRSKTIAVVGLSANASKPSYSVAAYLKSHGCRIIPINPNETQVLGEKSYRSLLDMPEVLKRQVEVVDIFRRPEDVPPVVEEAIELHRSYGRPSTVWMQLGIINESAGRKAEEAGLDLVMDRCMKIEYERLSSQST
jgi:predicted CoA-binding protein